MTNVNVNDLKQMVASIEDIESQKNDIAEQLKEAFAKAKHKGYDTKLLKQVIKLRKKSRDKLAHEEAIIETYRTALGI